MPFKMNRLTLNDHAPTDHAAACADRLAEALADGNSVLLTGSGDPSPLFVAAARNLRLLQAAVFHVGPPLDLISMLRQVTADDGPRDATLEEGFDLLTAPGAGCERIVLFVAEAHLLPHATLRYIEFALRAGPYLTVALAGQNGLSDLLALDGFAGLRNRMPVHLLLPDADPAHTDCLPAAFVPKDLDLAVTHRMTPPRLLACAAAAAGFVVVGMMSLSPSAPPVTAILAEPETAPSVAAVASPEPVSAQPAPVGVADLAEAPDTSIAAAQQAPIAAPLPSPATEVEPTFAAEASAVAGVVAVNAPDVPPASVPVSTPEAAAPPPGAPSYAAAAGTADVPTLPETAHAETSGILPGSAPEPDSEVAEAAAAPELHPATPSELPAAAPSQVEASDPGMVAALTAEPAARPDTRANPAAELPPAAQLTVPMPAARQSHAAVLPVLPRAPYRSTVIRPERVADRLPAPSGDGQRCRSINLRLQLGETPTDGDRAYLRNGCR